MAADSADFALHSADPLDLREGGRMAPPLDAVLAHSMLGTVAAAKAAIELCLNTDTDDMSRERLLRIATGRLDLVAKQLHRVSGGFVGEAIALAFENHRLAQDP